MSKVTSGFGCTIFVLFLVIGGSFAASFDCTKAKTGTEKTICSDPALSKLDDDLSVAYRKALKASASEAIKKEQRAWLKRTSSSCRDDSGCIKKTYEGRISQLDRKTDASGKASKKSSKKAVQKPADPLEFSRFTRERDYLDSPYEIASPEADQLLRQLEKMLLTSQKGKKYDEEYRGWSKAFISYLREGNGEYLKISSDVYIIDSYFVNASLSGVWLLDFRSSEFIRLASGYGLEIDDKNILPDGTQYILCKYGGLSRRQAVSGFIIITIYKPGLEVNVRSETLVDEASAYYDDEPKKDSYMYLCGEGETRMEGIAGSVLGYEWKDINNDGQKELVFMVEEKDCSNKSASSVQLRKVFAISKGKVAQIK
jgi:uncharacterized protein